MERKGICKNIGVCSQANNKKIQQILEDDLPFVCDECGEELVEAPKEEDKKPVSGGKGPKNLFAIIIAAVVLLGGGATAYFLFSNNEKEEVVINPPVMEKAKIIEESVVEEPVVEEEVVVEEVVEKPVTKEPKPVDKTSGTIAVTGGSYTGELKGGKPHGMGTIKYSSSTLIDSRDAKQRRAEAGQYITGEFYNGRLVQGKLYDSSDNQLENIILGRAN